MKIKNTINKILNVIFPNEIKCIFCGKELPEDTLYCDECKRSDILNIGNKCTKCDTIIKEGNIICDNCRDYKHAFDRCFAPLIYDGVVRKAIISFKSDNAKYRGVSECREGRRAGGACADFPVVLGQGRAASDADGQRGVFPL